MYIDPHLHKNTATVYMHGPYMIKVYPDKLCHALGRSFWHNQIVPKG